MSTAARVCSYCSKPSNATTVSTKPGDPEAARAALDHQDCYSRLLSEIPGQAPVMAGVEQ